MSVALGAALAIAAIASPARNDYANRAFSASLEAGLHAFYASDFKAAEANFHRASVAIADNTFALSFEDAAAAQQPGELDAVTNLAEDAVGDSPNSYAAHVRLGLAYLFQSETGRERTSDAHDEFETAQRLDPGAASAHVGLGIMYFDERSPNRAKIEFLAALARDPSNVLAREYLAQIYQSDLHDAARGLGYAIDVPNLVPGYADIAFHIGSLFGDLGQTGLAIDYVRRGIALDVDRIGEAGRNGYTLLARLYLREHRTSEAKATLERAVVLDADAVYARTLLDRMANGTADDAAGGVPAPQPT